MKTCWRTGLVSLAALTTIAVALPASAQNYPGKPIRLVVPFAPGGAADTTARVIGQGLAVALGKPVVVDNRAGGGGNIGAEIVAQAPSDGYTLLLGAVSHSIAPAMYKRLSYDFLRDFAPISLVTSSPLVVSVHPSVPVKSVKQLIAYAEAHPDRLNYSSAGVGSGLHLAGVLLCEMAGIRMNHVPFKGGALGLLAVVSGEVEVGISAITPAIPHIKSGRIRSLGIASARRSPLIPDVPTVSEAGAPGYEAALWYGLNAPAGSPQKIITRLNAESMKVLQQADVRGRLTATGIEPIGTTPARYDLYFRSEMSKWKKAVQAAGIAAR